MIAIGGARVWSWLLLTMVIKATPILETSCYFVNNAGLQVANGGPCGIVTPDTGFLMCCSKGDICLEHGICKWGKPVTGNSSGFYVGGCTDASMKDPSCSPACNDQILQDAVYNTTTGLWACCGVTDGKVHCNTPTKETFAAPAPAAMSSTFSVGELRTAAASSTSSSSSSASQTISQVTATAIRQATAISTATAIPQAESSSSSFDGHHQHFNSTNQGGDENSFCHNCRRRHGEGLSTGTIAAIGVSSVVGGFVIVGVFLLLLNRCHRKKQSDHQSNTMSYPRLEPNEQFRYPSIFKAPLQQHNELDSECTSPSSELDSNPQWSEKAVELP